MESVWVETFIDASVQLIHQHGDGLFKATAREIVGVHGLILGWSEFSGSAGRLRPVDQRASDCEYPEVVIRFREWKFVSQGEQGVATMAMPRS